jgi:acylphosphatase
MKCAHLIATGKVQGVSFRANTRDKAVKLGLKGYAKNLETGSVEVVAQGDEDKINELIEFLKNSPGISKVKDLQISHRELGEFSDFGII